MACPDTWKKDYFWIMSNPLKTESLTMKYIYKSGVWANKYLFTRCLILGIQALPAPSKLNGVKEHSWAWKMIIHSVESLEWSQNSFHVGQVAFSLNNSHLDSVDQGGFLAGKLNTTALFCMAKGVYAYD